MGIIKQPWNIKLLFSQCRSYGNGSASQHKSLWRVVRSAKYPIQWMRLMICWGMAVKRIGMLAVSVRKWSHWFWTLRQWHWLVMTDRIWHVLCIKCMKLIAKYVFLWANVLFLGGVISDLDESIFPWHMCSVWGGGGIHLGLELSYTWVNTVIFNTRSLQTILQLYFRVYALFKAKIPGDLSMCWRFYAGKFLSSSLLFEAGN